MSGEKNAPAKRTYTGSLAPQDIKPMMKSVKSLSLSFFKILALIYAGIEHPKPVTSGIKLCP